MKARTLPLLLAALASLAAASRAFAQEECEGRAGAGATKLTVRVSALKDAAGEVAVTVYPDDPRRFMAPGGKLLRQRVRAALPAASACFWLPPGAYAVAVYHDANRNRDFDRNPVGVPTEGFGFSNDAPTRFGLPEYDTARFRLPAGGAALSVKMRYLR